MRQFDFVTKAQFRVSKISGKYIENILITSLRIQLFLKTKLFSLKVDLLNLECKANFPNQNLSINSRLPILQLYGSYFIYIT